MDQHSTCATCRAPLPADGPSDWWCSETCQHTWQRLADNWVQGTATVVVEPGWALSAEIPAAEPTLDRPKPGDRLIFIENLADPEHPTQAELAAGVEVGVFAGDGSIAPPRRRGPIARALRSIRTTIRGNR